MFLALKEIKKEKFRSGLIIAMIVLISYLIFILTSLALGMARENTDAINSWGVAKITLSSNANVDMRQSFLTQKQAGTLSKNEAYLGETPVVAEAKGHQQQSAFFVGLKSTQFIAKKIKLESGHRVRHSHEVVVDDALKLKGYQLGDSFKLNDDKTKFTIVGFTKRAKLNVTPVIYGQLGTWRALRGIKMGPVTSVVASKTNQYQSHQDGTKTYTRQQIINKLPGYQAQILTFVLMIGFLMVISMIIIAVFLYILTLQKLPNYAVLRAQGIPSKVLVGATISQSFLLVASGLIIGTVLTAVTGLVIPAQVPMAFNIPLLAVVGLVILVMALIGSLIPVKTVLNVDPVSVMGGE
ncbi:antimicrobial peptide ABC transporter permease protein [Secundilactobacillus pentosiphilus]|uniref:Putative hemin transport system permease protein HrtB n=1 Tax=Secundilactobacillus pentosiphilus TaxID=1714682 RepID=A0A1Z5IYH6_9LACO|nr:ABC transporter permease [Secundilactobacillus pentosiphilus]GAX06622.1 antimicrobial peptide ABC transporter permease protein [Secundilactobacillus pentosiphilus]